MDIDLGELLDEYALTVPGLIHNANAAVEDIQMLAHNISREEVFDLLFTSLDSDHDQQLSQDELRSVVHYLGFEGSDAEWLAVYGSLRSSHSFITGGMNLTTFKRFIGAEDPY